MRLLLLSIWAVALVAAGALMAQTAPEERRVALIIGNSDYAHVTPLDNPGNDAADMSVALEGLGFEVFLGLDVTLAELERLTETFAGAIAEADVTVFYYAGHGFQIGGENYLVPTDAQIRSASDVVDQTTAMSEILAVLEAAPGIKFVFLDACRDNPFESVLATVSEGLARIGNARDFMISFATQPDNVAYDGTGRNSFFTEALLGHIYTPGLDVSDLMIQVRKDVLAATGGRQIPWENSSLTRQFRFDPRPDTVSAETLLWQVAANARDPQLMRLYAERYPEGTHLPEVMAFLDPEAAETGVLSRTYTPGETDAQEERLWQLAQRSRMRPLVQFYLDQYPQGLHAREARRLIATLPAEDEGGPGRLCERLATHPRDATASTAGIPFAQLQQRAVAAVQACEAAAAAAPQLPHYTALLARATIATGDLERAVTLYQDAADRGDLRAMVSLGLLMEQGQGLPQNQTEALRLYQKAANGGSPDGMINLAYALFNGAGVQPDPDRAIALFRAAADLGSPIATFNLGVLTQDGVTGEPAEALALFRKAAQAGEMRGYVAGAILLDEGRGVPRDPRAAANMLLRGAAEDGGQSIAELTQKTGDWSRETIMAVQEKLRAAGHYDSTIDGLAGPRFAAALETWRNGGFDERVLTE
jgi:TPR repeat protein